MYIRGRLHIINFKITYVKQAKKKRTLLVTIKKQDL